MSVDQLILDSAVVGLLSKSSANELYVLSSKIVIDLDSHSLIFNNFENNASFVEIVGNVQGDTIIQVSKKSRRMCVSNETIGEFFVYLMMLPSNLLYRIPKGETLEFS